MRRLSVSLSFVTALTLALLGSPAAANHNTEPHHRLAHLANSPNPETTNSDLAFWGNLMAQGVYNGFRLFNISNPASPRLLIDEEDCGGSQGDVSLHKAGDRLLLFRSIDAPQDRPECEGSVGRNATTNADYFEGIRIIDVTNPRSPKFVKGVYTDCGSHTHTTIRDTKNNRAIIYVSSYPLGAPTQDPDGADPKHEGCIQPHQKIGIIVVPNGNPAGARLHHYQDIEAAPVVAGTPAEVIASPGTIGCHDITAYTHPKVKAAAAACITEGQLWDISNPLFPCTTDDSCHTHIDNPAVEIWHSSTFTWDAKVVLFGDEHGGGAAPGCGGSEDPTGNAWFYQNVEPGTPTAPLLGRYHLPRPQPDDPVCSIHNFNIIPIDGSRSYIGVSGTYGGGTTVFNFTQLKTALPVPIGVEGSAVPIVANEIAFWDTQTDSDEEGNNDVWSAYWYNNFIHASDIVRGLDVYKFLRQTGAQFTALRFGFHNPQTQERLLLPSTGGGDPEDD